MLLILQSFPRIENVPETVPGNLFSVWGAKQTKNGYFCYASYPRINLNSDLKEYENIYLSAVAGHDNGFADGM